MAAYVQWIEKRYEVLLSQIIFSSLPTLSV